jgi:hypothetical protein
MVFGSTVGGSYAIQLPADFLTAPANYIGKCIMRGIINTTGAASSLILAFYPSTSTVAPVLTVTFPNGAQSILMEAWCVPTSQSGCGIIAVGTTLNTLGTTAPI